MLTSYDIKYYKPINNSYKCSTLRKKSHLTYENKYKNHKTKQKKPTTQIELHSTQARRDLFWKAMTF